MSKAHLNKHLKSYNRCFFGLLVLIFLVSINSSCTVQKRVHRKGWFVQWNGFKSDHERQENTRSLESINLIESAKEVSQKRKTDSGFKVTSATQIEEGDSNELSNTIIILPTENPLPDTYTPSDSLSTFTTTSNTTSMQETLPQKIALLVMSVNLFIGIFLAINLGILPILIPLGISVFIALITLISIRENRNNPESVSAKKKLWIMLIMMSIAWLLFLTLTFLSLTPLTSSIAIITGVLLAMGILSKMALPHKKSLERHENDTNQEVTDDQDISAHEEEANENIPPKAKSTEPISMSSLFPELTVGIILSFILALLLIVGYLILVGLASLTGLSSSLSIILLLLSLISFIIGFILSAIRQNKYKAYKTENGLDQSNLSHNGKSVSNNDRKVLATVFLVTISVIGLVTAMLFLL